MKKPSNLFAPLVIAGVTVGFLASAYKYIFRYKPSQRNTTQQTLEEHPEHHQVHQDDEQTHHEK